MRKAMEWMGERSTGIALAALAGLVAVAFGEYAGAVIASASRIFVR